MILKSSAAQATNPGQTIEQRLGPSAQRAQMVLEQVLRTLRVAAPAVVKSFSPGPPATVSVVLANAELVSQNDGSGFVSMATDAVELPVLDDVPVLVPCAGGWSLTFPIAAGDECLVVFGDTPLDVWFQNGGTGNNPISQRRHSLSDAIAIFGLRSTPRGISNWSTDSAQLRNDAGTVVIDMGPDTITVSAPKVVVNSTESVTVNSTGHCVIDDVNYITHYHLAPYGDTGPPLGPPRDA